MNKNITTISEPRYRTSDGEEFTNLVDAEKCQAVLDSQDDAKTFAQQYAAERGAEKRLPEQAERIVLAWEQWKVSGVKVETAVLSEHAVDEGGPTSGIMY